MSAEEVLRLKAATQILADTISADVHRGDVASLRHDIAELGKEYPDAPRTILWQMNLAFVDKDFPKADALYQRLMTQYPDVQNMRAKFTHDYQGLTRAYNSPLQK